MATTSSTRQASVPRLRYGIAVLLGFGVRSTIEAVGLGILSSAFSYTYAASQIPVGITLDRFGVVTIGRAGAQATHSFTIALLAAAVILLSGSGAYTFVLDAIEPIPEPAA